jgi:hypothetical protein
MARDERVLATIARTAGLARVASSNDHGWSRTAAAWSVVPVPGWRTLDAPAFGAAIRARVALGAASGIRVVERRRVIPPAGLIGLALTVPAVVWQLLRTLSPAERICWVAWIWGFALVAFHLRGRSVRRPPGERRADPAQDVPVPG